MSLCGGHKRKSPTGLVDISYSQPTSRMRKFETLSTCSELMGTDNPLRCPCNRASIQQSNASWVQLSAPDPISLVGMVNNVLVRSILLRRERTAPNGTFQ